MNKKFNYYKHRISYLTGLELVITSKWRNFFIVLRRAGIASISWAFLFSMSTPVSCRSALLVPPLTDGHWSSHSKGPARLIVGHHQVIVFRLYKSDFCTVMCEVGNHRVEYCLQLNSIILYLHRFACKMPGRYIRYVSPTWPEPKPDIYPINESPDK